jgi:hypothetical protein
LGIELNKNYLKIKANFWLKKEKSYLKSCIISIFFLFPRNNADGNHDVLVVISTEMKMRPLLSRVEMTSYRILRVMNKVLATLKKKSKRQERKQGINYRIH